MGINLLRFSFPPDLSCRNQDTAIDGITDRFPIHGNSLCCLCNIVIRVYFLSIEVILTDRRPFCCPDRLVLPRRHINPPAVSKPCFLRITALMPEMVMPIAFAAAAILSWVATNFPSILYWLTRLILTSRPKLVNTFWFASLCPKWRSFRPAFLIWLKAGEVCQEKIAR